MKLLDLQELQSLTQPRDTPCISIYMPTHRVHPELREDSLRLKNLIGLAEDRLGELGLRTPELKAIMEPGADLLDDTRFWQHQADGLALFFSRDFFRYYRVPLSFDEVVVATDRFHIKPLIPLFAENGRYYTLALSQNRVRLLQCTRFSVQEVDLEETSIPTSISEALAYDDPEKQLQFRSSTGIGSPPGSGRWGAIFHGHGAVEQEKEDLRRYFLQIDGGFRELVGEKGPPLVLGGVDYLLPIYSEAAKYNNLMEEGVRGNPDEYWPEELRELAWPVVEPYFMEVQQQTQDRYHEMLAKGLASSDTHKVVPAAHYGQVESLFVAVGVQVWGVFQPGTDRAQVHEEYQAGDEDLLDLAAVQTMFNSGRVFAVPPERVPGEQRLAAIFRY